MPPISLLICDDSNVARKQVLRALPPAWAVSISQAGDGEQALDLLRASAVDLLLLDLTMPILDGYGVLAAMRSEALPAEVIVISADVQEEAVRRVMELGALAFLKKPVDAEQLLQTLIRSGLFVRKAHAGLPALLDDPKVSFRDAFCEVINLAMGRAAALLARVLGVFVHLPVPNVNILEVGELHMALADVRGGERLTAVCQGYIGGGICGEALLIFHDCDMADMARLMRSHSDDYTPLEMLLDMSGILIGACLGAIAEQVNVHFSQGHPQILGEHAPVDELIRINHKRWRKTLAVEISYSIEGHGIHFDLLLLFTEDSVPLLTRKLAYLTE